MGIDALAFQVTPTSGIPIYRQIVDQVRAMVSAGKLQSGDMLPSTRDLATTLQINMMTVSRAYQQLAADGVVENVRGRGMRCIGGLGIQSAAERKADFYASVQPAILHARALGLNDQQIEAIIKRILKKHP